MRRSVLFSLLAFALAITAAGCDSLDSPGAEAFLGTWQAVDVRTGLDGSYSRDETSALETAGTLTLAFSDDGAVQLAFVPAGTGRLAVSGLPTVTLGAQDVSGTYTVQPGASEAAEDDGVIMLSGTGSAGPVELSAPYRFQGGDRFRLDLDASEIEVLLGLNAPTSLGTRLTFERQP